MALDIALISKVPSVLRLPELQLFELRLPELQLSELRVPGLGLSAARFAVETEAKSGMDMMDDGPSVALFLSLVALLVVLAIALLPQVFRRLTLRKAVPGLALVGPLLALIGGIIGTGAMTLSGRDIWYSLVVALAAASAAIIVGLQLAIPVARDLESIGSTVKAVAGGDRSARTDIDRSDEVGVLAAAVDDLSRSLAEAEAERAIAEEERTAVVSALSHDLRTPLASLLVSIDAVEDGIGDAPSHLKAMRGNVMALDHLVEDLFLLARADSGALALNFETIDLAELIDDAVEALRPLAATRMVAIDNSITEPLLVSGDHTALGRVFRNLLDNALRHSPLKGTVALSFASDAGRVRVSIADQGKGFDPAFVPRALDRFTQADDARTVQGAAGLGLAIADTLMQAHRGEVAIHPGPGGKVDVSLALVAPAAPSRLTSA
ncbi:MAG: HAMP domain-containing sensor histidine kinase [Acidimicrobiales bacterium]